MGRIKLDNRSLSHRLALISLFGGSIFLSKIILPTPIDKMFLVLQAMMLALGTLYISRFGGTSVALIGGLLTTLWRPSFAPFSLIIAVMYGMLMDILIFGLRVKIADNEISLKRLVVAITIATSLTGILGYYVTVLALELLPRNVMLEILIFAAAIVNGVVAGFLTARVWRVLK